MNPPVWLDEDGRSLAKVWSVVEWCGHQIEGIPVPNVEGRGRLIVVQGEATWQCVL